MEKQKQVPEKGTPEWRNKILYLIPSDPGINIFHSKEKDICIVRTSSHSTVTTETKRGESIIFNVDNNGDVISALGCKGIRFHTRYKQSEISGITNWLDDALEKSAPGIKEKFQPKISPDIAARRSQVAEEVMDEVDPSLRPKKTGGSTSDIITWDGDK